MTRILWNGKDHPELYSGYGIIGHYILPLLAEHYGKDNVLVLAPVYQRDMVSEWEGLTVLPGTQFDFGEGVVLDHYRFYKCDLLLMTGDAWALGALPDMAARNDLVWVHWLPVDWLGMPKNIRNRIQYAHKLVPYSKEGEARLRKSGFQNVEKAIWLGLNTELWRPKPREELPEIMNLLGFENDTFNILMVTANQERKNILEQLQGLKLFWDIHPEAKPKLFIHTTMKRERDLFADIDELGLAELVTYPDQYMMTCGGVSEKTMVDVFNCADVVLNVCHEGFGYATLQSQALGIPTIFLAEGSSPELVKMGIGVPSITAITAANMMSKAWPNVPAIGRALEEVWKQRVAAGGPVRSQKAIQFVQNNFAWPKIAAQWIDVIDRMMQEKDHYCYDVPQPSTELQKRSEEELVLS
jgi:glycosyltransferase involved in cell wall biosynthesis